MRILLDPMGAIGGFGFGGGGGGGGGMGGMGFSSSTLASLPVIGGLFGTPNLKQANVPRAGDVGSQYLSLVQAFLAGEPSVYQNQAEFQPKFEQLDLNAINQALPTLINASTTANSAARTANVNDVSRLGSGAVDAIRSLNPNQTALTDALTKTATDQLALGTSLDPATTSRVTNSVRSNWTSRGLGDSLPAGLDEAMQLYGAGENLLTSRENEAGNVANMENSQYTIPGLNLIESATSNAPAEAGAVANSAGPTLFPAAENYDIFNTAYNANAAASIANANNFASIKGAQMSY